MPVNGSAGSVGSRQAIREIVSQYLKGEFASSLGKETDVENIVMGLIYLESSFKTSANHQLIPLNKSSTARKIFASSAVKKVQERGVPTEVANLADLRRAWGLMGVMGWNLAKGADPSGKTEIERVRPDLAAQVMVNPGDSIKAHIDGDQNIRKQILAGLIMLESKYRMVQGSNGNFNIGTHRFTSKLQGAISAYLGLGPRDVVTGISYRDYTNSIMYGNAYQKGNGPGTSATVANPSQQRSSQNGPPTTAASGQNKHPTGC